MSGIAYLFGQIGIVMGGFLGMASLLSWYHKEGDKKNDKNNNKLHL